MARTFLSKLLFIQIPTAFTAQPEYRELMYRMRNEKHYNLCEPFALLIMVQTMAANSDAGYWIRWSEATRFDLMEKTSISFENIDMIIKLALEVGMFDNDIFKNSQILTGDYIQDSYFAAITRMRRIVPQGSDFLRFLTANTKKKYCKLLEENMCTSEMSSSVPSPAGMSVDVAGMPIDATGKPIPATGKPIPAVEGNEDEEKRTGGEGNSRALACNKADAKVVFDIHPRLEWIPIMQRESLQSETMIMFKRMTSLPSWARKSREAVEEAERKIKKYYYDNPYLPPIVLSNHIQKDMGYICDPTESEIRLANERLRNCREQSVEKIKSGSEYIPYEALEENGMTDFKREWDLVMGQMPNELLLDAKQTKFLTDSFSTRRKILAKDTVAAWMKDAENIESVMNVTGGRLYSL